MENQNIENQNIEANEIDYSKLFLGSIFYNVSNLIENRHRIKIEWFNGNDGIIYNAMLRVFDSKKEVDVFTVYYELEKSNELKKLNINDPQFFTKLSLDSSEHGNEYAELMEKNYLRNESIKVVNKFFKEVGKHELHNIENLINILYKDTLELFKCNSTSTTNDKKSIYEILKETYDDDEKFRKSENEFTGLPTGIKQLDNFLNGIQSGELIVLGADTSQGKSVFATNMMNNMINKYNTKINYFNLEMSNRQFGTRIFGMESGVAIRKDKKYSDWEMKQRCAVLEKYRNKESYIYSTRTKNFDDIRNNIIQNKLNGKLDFAIIDYLQRIPISNQHKNNLRTYEFENMANDLRNLAIEWDIPIMLLVQLNRNITGRTTPRPTKHDLKDCGALEQIADLIIQIYRPSEYESCKVKPNDKERNKDKYGVDYNYVFDDGSPADGLAEIIIPKGRVDGTYNFKMEFIPNQQLFLDLEEPCRYAKKEPPSEKPKEPDLF